MNSFAGILQGFLYFLRTPVLQNISWLLFHLMLIVNLSNVAVITKHYIWAIEKNEAKFTNKHTKKVHRHTYDYLSSFAVLLTKNNETLNVFSLKYYKKLFRLF